MTKTTTFILGAGAPDPGHRDGDAQAKSVNEGVFTAEQAAKGDAAGGNSAPPAMATTSRHRPDAGPGRVGDFLSN